MGVPLLFKYFARQCPEAVKDTPPPPEETTHLYFDFNNVVHNCALLPEVSSEDEVIAASIEHVRKLSALISPTDTLFVAVDGVPPRAKMLQQRARRFAGVSDDADAGAGAGSKQNAAAAWWNSCVVTPGTAFMNRLSIALHRELHSTIVSDASEPGEGEQKLFRHLLAQTNVSAVSAVICGMDADLIVMGLVATLRGHRIHVARDANTYVDVNAIASHIHTNVMKAETPSSSIRQFVAMLALLGNDFVPAIPGLSLAHGGIEALVRSLSNRSLMNEHSAADIDMKVLHAVLLDLSRTESGAVRLAESRGDPRDGTVHPEAPGWRPRYNRRVFGVSSPDRVQEICKAYVAGLVWNAAYMIEQRTLSEGFTYPYTYAPTAHDLALVIAPGSSVPLEIPRYLDLAEEADRKARIACGASREAWQLCHVLPPSQAHLLLEGSRGSVLAIHRAMTDARYGAAHFYPTGFSRSSYLVPMRAPAHLRAPILPVFDDHVLTNAITSASASEKHKASCSRGA